MLWGRGRGNWFSFFSNLGVKMRGREREREREIASVCLCVGERERERKLVVLVGKNCNIQRKALFPRYLLAFTNKLAIN